MSRRPELAGMNTPSALSPDLQRLGSRGVQEIGGRRLSKTYVTLLHDCQRTAPSIGVRTNAGYNVTRMIDT